jgi:UDP-glucose 4-epimerase
MLTNKNVLITGGEGFIGSSLARFLAKNNNIKIFDIKTGKDIRNLDLLKNELKDVDFVFHFAGLISVEESTRKPLDYIENNAIGSYNVLKAALDTGVKKVIFASSAAIYGDYPENPKNEKMYLIPKTPYSILKLTIERIMEIFRNDGLDTVSLRFFNIYGPGQKLNSSYSAVILIFINNALKNENLVIFGDGKQTRDFIYIKDVINACILAAERGSGEFNIGSGIPTSINDLAKLIIELTNSKVKILYEKQREGDIINSLADISKANELLGFKPIYDIRTGLKETINWFKNQK